MAALSNYAENEILDVLLGFNSTGFPDISNTYVALFTSDPGEDASGNEVSGTSYARVTVGNDSGDGKWDASANGVKKNAATITFPAAGGSWGTVTHVAIFTASSGTTNLIAYGPLSTSKTVGNADVFSFGIGDLQITLD